MIIFFWMDVGRRSSGRRRCRCGSCWQARVWLAPGDTAVEAHGSEARHVEVAPWQRDRFRQRLLPRADRPWRQRGGGPHRPELGAGNGGGRRRRQTGTNRPCCAWTDRAPSPRPSGGAASSWRTRPKTGESSFTRGRAGGVEGATVDIPKRTWSHPRGRDHHAGGALRREGCMLQQGDPESKHEELASTPAESPEGRWERLS